MQFSSLDGSVKVDAPSGDPLDPEKTRLTKHPPKEFRFIDLFCGIGGFRIAFQRAGGKCVFSSDWDKFSQQTYEINFGERPFGDIRRVDISSIPKFDVLCAGLPC